MTPNPAFCCSYQETYVMLCDLLKVFDSVPSEGIDPGFLPTSVILHYLRATNPSGWSDWVRGGALTAESLAVILRRVGIRSVRNRKQTCRGYLRRDVADCRTPYCQCRK